MEILGLFIPNIVAVIVAVLSFRHASKGSRDANRLTYQSITYESKRAAYQQFISTCIKYIYKDRDTDRDTIKTMIDARANLSLYAPYGLEDLASKLVIKAMTATEATEMTELGGDLHVLIGKLKEDLAKPPEVLK